MKLPDTTNVEPSESFDVIPPGTYTAVAIDNEWLETRAGNGHYLKLCFEIVGPEFAGRKVWANLNLDNPNEKAVQIAMRDLAALKEACGKPNAQDSDELMQIPVNLKITVRPPRGDYGASNEIKGYMPTGTPTGQYATQAPAKRQPWEK